MRVQLAIVLCGFAAFALPLCAAEPPPPAAAFDHADFTANGAHEAILTVPAFGRYVITVSSAQGTALQLVDRMAGPGEIEGEPGQSDGRIDAFLERGAYKIRLISDARGAGTARLAVLPFTELQPGPVLLVENKPVLAPLADAQQRSWWINVPARGTYSFEAGGRTLNDLRLWQPGGWMLPDTPVSAETDADPQRPLALRQLVAQLEPGIYRLTAYGGGGLSWSKASADAPFMLRWGVPRLSDAGRTIHVMSQLGIDRFIVPGTATAVDLVIDHPETADLAAQPYSAATMFQTGAGSDVGIDKTSRDPVASMTLSADDTKTPWLITVTYRPGAKYRLEVLNAAASTTLSGRGETLLAVTPAGDLDDQIDPGFMITDPNERVVAFEGIELDKSLPWRRHFNLLDTVSTFLHTDRNVDLRIDGSGARAGFMIARMLQPGSPADQVVPPPKPSGGVWPLTPGYYALGAFPQSGGKGILTMSMYQANTPPPTHDSARQPAMLVGDLDLDPKNPLTLTTAFDDDQSYGLSQVSLPATLAAPLSLELGAGGAVTIPIVVAQVDELAVTDEAGAAVDFSLDGKLGQGCAPMGAGPHRLRIAGPAAGNQIITIAATPQRLRDTVLPAIPAAQIAPPALPQVLPDQPRYIDLARNQTTIFSLPVAGDALYRFETTGLLETGGAIRTRTNPALANAEGNGIGRNFVLQPFLRQGDYQVSVQAQGQTTGHAGVSVTHTPLIEAGVLAPGRPARLTLAPGQAAEYRFSIMAAGSYHLFTLGLGHQFTMRLEDEDGWPLLTPGGAADATMDFRPGRYRMILLPGTVENRAVTMLQALPPPAVYQGHGPFAVAFGQNLANRWMEPAPGQPRTPDVWAFALPAAATVTVRIDGGMKAAIFAKNSTMPIATTGRGWTGKLGAGAYEIVAMSAAPDNRVDYTLNVDLAELLPGQSRDITAPVTIPLSLGGGAQYEISSFGGQDVKATLLDAAGNQLAVNDDRADDWNFLISGSFPAGLYSLRVEPSGTDSAETQISITSPATVPGPALAAGVPVRFADGLVHLMPLPAIPPGALILAGATAAAPVGLALEIFGQDQTWRTLATTTGLNPYLAVPAGAGARPYRLRAWAEDHGATPVEITALGVAPPAADPASLAGGLALSAVTLGSRRVGVARVGIDHAQIMQLQTPSDTLQWGGTAALAHDGSGTIVAPGPALWFTDVAPHEITARPVDLLTQSATVMLAGPLTLPLPQVAGIALWRAAAQGAQPGIGVDDGVDDAVDGGAGDRAMALAGAGTLRQAWAFQTVNLATPALHLFAAGPATAPLQLSIQRFGFAAPAAFNLQTGGNGGTLAGQTAIAATLPGGWKRLTLALPDGMVAVLTTGQTVQTLVAGNGGAPDVLESNAAGLTLLNPGGGPAPYSISMLPVAQPRLVLAPGGLFTRYSATPAVLHLTLPPGAATRLNIGGAATDLITIGADGETGTAATDGGTALVTAAPGLMVVSSAGAAPAEAVQPVALPGRIGLVGARMTLQLPAGPARLINLQTDAPILLRDQNSFIPAVFPAGAAANLFQPKGVALKLDIAAAGVQALSGTAQLAAIDAIPIADGLGPKFLAAPGQSLLFSFSLSAARSIGVGVRGSIDDAQCRLLAADGTVLGSGVIHMNQLPPGAYFLAVDVPANAAATVIQPALVGLTLPDNGPPPDVIASYAALAGQPSSGAP